MEYKNEEEGVDGTLGALPLFLLEFSPEGLLVECGDDGCIGI